MYMTEGRVLAPAKRIECVGLPLERIGHWSRNREKELNLVRLSE